MTQSHIGVLQEKSLHASVKAWYAGPKDHLEKKVDGYVVDIVRHDDLLVEIQTRSFAPLKRKLGELTQTRRVRLVHPIATEKWIVKVDAEGEPFGRRKSPKRGRVEDVFKEMVSIPHLMERDTFAVEVLLIQEEDVRCYDGKGSWRHPEWRAYDRRLVEVVDRRRFTKAADFLEFLPDEDLLPRPFTNRELAKATGLRMALAGKMTYSLRHMGALTVVGKKGNAQLFTVEPQMLEVASEVAGSIEATGYGGVAPR